MRKLGILLSTIFLTTDCGNLSSGVYGTSIGGSTPTQYTNYLYSNSFRAVGTTQILESSEVTTYSGSSSNPNLPANYSEVPDVLIDDDGYYNADAGCGANCTTVVNITAAQHAAFINCGPPFTSISDRVNDCSSKNPAAATWLGSVNSTQGQGNWSLVTRIGANKEVWQDQTTGLIWSSVISAPVGDNWCRASGNAQATDPSNFCNIVAYQPQYPIPESDCTEFAGAVPTPGWCNNGNAYATAIACTTAGGVWTANTDNWIAGTYNAAKGNMGANSALLKVRWRLPTIHDFGQAEIDGIRSVMPDMGAFYANGDWSSSLDSSNRFDAWQFVNNIGQMFFGNRSSNLEVRCVGR